MRFRSLFAAADARRRLAAPAAACPDARVLAQVAKALLRAGAGVNLRTPAGTPLEILLKGEDPSPALVRELVLAGADLGLEGGWVGGWVRVCKV